MRMNPLAVVVAAMLACVPLSYTAQAAAPPDAGLYTQFSFPDAETTVVNWMVCGTIGSTEGCYDVGSLGPFGKVDALLQGEPRVNGQTVTRAIYVLDTASGPHQKGVTLNVFTKTDTITSDFDTVTVTLSRKVNLPLVGGANAAASMAANKLFPLRRHK